MTTLNGQEGELVLRSKPCNAQWCVMRTIEQVFDICDEIKLPLLGFVL